MKQDTKDTIGALLEGLAPFIAIGFFIAVFFIASCENKYHNKQNHINEREIK